MALGDGVRRNLATVSQAERDRLRDAIIKLQTVMRFPGARSDMPVGGVTWWFKQDEIHAHSHVHGVPAFVPWHRELINRFEAMIRTIDPELSLHYWDWTQDPRNLPDGQGGTVDLFKSDFLGSPSGLAREPLQADVAPYRPDGFYVPGASPARSNNEFDPNNNPFDPPLDITRSVGTIGPPVPSDSAVLAAGTYKAFHDQLSNNHNYAHGYIGGTLSDAHTSFRDPVAFFLHSNVDRLFAMWQRDPAHPERLDPSHVYDHTPGDWPLDPEKGSGDVATGAPWWGFSSPLEPWASPGAQTAATGIVANVEATRPWAPLENQQLLKDCRHYTVVRPPCYDTAPCGGHLWHTLRRTDGGWTGLGDVQGQFAIPGPVVAVAGTGGSAGETQFMFTTADGHLWHTLRRADGGWSGLGDVQGQFGVPGAVAVVAAASGAPGETQFMFTTADGHLWHTLRRADGTWTGLGDVQGQFGIPGPVAAVAAAGGAPGETQFMFTTADGHLWHTLRRADGSWTGLGDVQGQFAIPGPVAAVAAASGAPSETQFMFTTDDGHVWHTLRRADGSWTGLGDVQGQFAIPGPVYEVAGTRGAAGETQFMFATADGHLWHTLRRADGSWSGLGDVQGQFAVPGPVNAVAAASGAPGETQFMFTA